VLVLDEATSNLDLQSETKIEAALDVLLEGRTAILIAHRLSTAMKADRIVVVDEGRIIEIGSHDELIARWSLRRDVRHLGQVSRTTRPPSPPWCSRGWRRHAPTAPTDRAD
jgi:ABC-type multidrug transport system fused ATPase/permease subunit